MDEEMSSPQAKRSRTDSPQPMDVDERRKPKMRADVRRAVVVHALRVEAPQNVAIEEHVLNEEERWALQIRVLRMFFSCRAFSAVIFQSMRADDKGGRLVFSEWPKVLSVLKHSGEDFADELLLQKARGWIVEGWGKEEGIPSLSLESMIRLPHPIMHFGEYKRVFAAVAAYFDEFPDHEPKTEDFDGDLIEKYRFTWDKPVSLWTHRKNGNRSRFLLTYNLLEVY
ncbi:hypothetical protein M3Y99_00247000 [Aphelenchoides fujianensis]|nr:hypothetical protein M3Y99_00247000 [Aphelenchoides fujianensis]